MLLPLLGRAVRRLTCTALALAALAGPVHALPPRDELLRLVPPDAGFCFILQDLRGHARAFLESPFAGQLLDSPVGVAVRRAPETGKLLETANYLQARLQIDWARVRDDIVGDAVVLAFWPGPVDHPEEEQGLILLRAREPRALATLVDRLEEFLKQPGKAAASEQREYNGVAYAAWNDGKKVTYAYRRGPVLALTHQENLLRRVMDLDRQAPPDAEPSVTRQLRRLGAERALATLWVNPRSFEAGIEPRNSSTSSVEAAVRRTILAYWKALDGVVLSASVQKADLELSLALLLSEGRLPEPARTMLARGAQASELWAYFPPNAMFTVAGRIDSVGMTELLCQFLTDPVRKFARETVDRYVRNSLGQDVAAEVLPYLGPDWGFCVTAPGPDRKGWFPNVTGALRIQPNGRQPPLDRILFDTLNGLALLAVFAYNNAHPDQLALRTVMQGQVEVRYLTNEKSFPAGLQPAFALKGGYLVVGSSPAAVSLFRKATPTAGVPSSQPEVRLLRLSLTEVRRYLASQADVVTAFIAEKEQLSTEEAARRLNDLLGAIQLFDQVEIGQRCSPGQLALTLRVKTAQPMK